MFQFPGLGGGWHLKRGTSMVLTGMPGPPAILQRMYHGEKLVSPWLLSPPLLLPQSY